MRVFRRCWYAIRNLVTTTDMFLLISVFLACAYGFILVFSVAHTNGTGYQMQLISIVLGLILAVVISRIDYEMICTLWMVLAGVSLLLVLLTFTPLGINVPGTDDTAWLGIKLGSRTVSFQPSELLKIAFIITFSRHLSMVQEHINRPLTIVGLCAHGLLPAMLVFLQGDDGTACIFLCIFISMMFIAGVKPLYFVGAMAAIAAAIPLLWDRLPADKKERFLCIIFVEKYADGIGWQQSIGLSAIGSGQLSGVGYLQGGAHHLYARDDDMIFTVAGEEFGFVGAIALLLVLLLVLAALLRVALRAKDRQGMYLCIGMLALVGFQSLINIGMSLRLLPILGITLPFFSAGGSSVATLLIGIGVILSVSRCSRDTRNRKNSLRIRT